MANASGLLSGMKQVGAARRRKTRRGGRKHRKAHRKSRKQQRQSRKQRQ